MLREGGLEERKGIFIAGVLFKRGRRFTFYWSRRYYAIVGPYLCELTRQPAELKANILTILPFHIDIHDRSSVRRVMYLTDAVNCRQDNSSTFTINFRQDNSSRAYVFRSPGTAQPWIDSVGAATSRNREMVHSDGVDAQSPHEMINVQITEGPDLAPLSIFMKRNIHTVRDLRDRITERRGLLPSQQILCFQVQNQLTTFKDDTVISSLAAEGDDVILVTLQGTLLSGALCAGPEPGSQGTLLSDLEPTPIDRDEHESKLRYKSDWSPPTKTSDALVLYHSKFPAHLNLCGLDASSDDWWREHLALIHLTPHPVIFLRTMLLLQSPCRPKTPLTRIHRFEAPGISPS